MIRLNRSKVEKNLGESLAEGIDSMGVDTASRTGWALATVEKDEILIDAGFIDIDTKDLFFKYNKLIEIFQSLISPKKDKEYRLVIEDTFFGRNVASLKLISRIGMIAYIIGHLKGVNNKEFIYATSSRKNLGIKGTAKKEEVHKELVKILGIKLPDPDIADAIVLALNGLITQKGLT